MTAPTEQEKTKEVIRRTMFNLRFIEQHAAKEGPYEVTQLLNSFLGALAHPWEEPKPQLSLVSLDGWPAVVKELPSDRDVTNLGELIRRMRNGIARAHFEFLSDANLDITLLTIWDEDPNTRQRVWGKELSVADLRALLERFAGLADDLL